MWKAPLFLLGAGVFVGVLFILVQTACSAAGEVMSYPITRAMFIENQE